MTIIKRTDWNRYPPERFYECFKCGKEDRQEFGQEKQIFKFGWFASIKDRLNQIHGLKVNPEKKVWVCDACIVEHQHQWCLSSYLLDDE